MTAKVVTFSNYDDAEALQRVFALPFNKLDGTAAPGIADDDSAGFVAGSVWADRTNDKAYICVENATGAAVWREVTGGGGGAGDVVGPASAVNSGVALFDGVTGKLIKDGGVLGTAAFTASGAYDAAGAAAAAQAASQPIDATLTALAGANWAANALPIGSGADTVAQISFAANTFPARASTGDLVAKPITDFGLSLVDDADAATARTTLGLGTLATQSGTFSGTSSGTNTGDQTNVSGNAATVTTNANLTGPVTSVGNATTIAAGVVTEAMQVLADNTTQDVSTAKHGYAPKAPNDATKFLNGLGAYAVPAGSGMSNTIILEDQKTSGTDGGTFISGAWRTRDLNTEVADTGGDCTLASNQFTLVAGTYELIASAPGYIVTYHQARLQNITDATTIASGTSEYTYGSYFTNNRSIINTRFTIASSTAFEIQHRCGATAATNGFGVGSGASFTVAHETYTQVWIKRVA